MNEVCRLLVLAPLAAAALAVFGGLMFVAWQLLGWWALALYVWIAAGAYIQSATKPVRKALAPGLDRAGGG